ncbi:MAG: twin-arginine translocation signal domain-containing protein [Saprospiraceae bacterium]|nr:twin-arginine translocation signal domain-containing protein [Saprospiraceae bacterium]
MKKNNRRNFIKKSAVLTAALSLGGKSTAIAATDHHLKPPALFRDEIHSQRCRHGDE